MMHLRRGAPIVVFAMISSLAVVGGMPSAAHTSVDQIIDSRSGAPGKPGNPPRGWEGKVPFTTGQVDLALPFETGFVQIVPTPGHNIVALLSQFHLLGPATLVNPPPFSDRDRHAGLDRSFRVPVLPGTEKATVLRLAPLTQLFQHVGLFWISRPVPTLTPVDALYVAGFQGNLDAMHLPRAWDRTTSFSGIHIAVIDSGLRGTHEEVVGKQELGRDFFADPVDGVPIFPRTQSDGSCVLGHGTGNAVLAAGNTNNAFGVASTGFNSNIIPIKIFSSTAACTDNLLMARATPIRWAYNITNVTHVIAMPYKADGPDFDEQAALQEAWTGTSQISNIGSSGNVNNSNPTYPCAYVYVMCVGASDNAGNRWQRDATIGTTFGSFVNFAAPGIGIWSARGDSDGGDSGYVARDGSSIATAEVAGVAALLRSIGYTPDQQRTALNATAVPVPGNWCSTGFVDAGAALWRQP